MKKTMFILVLTLCWLIQAVAQDVVYGTVRTDGYQKITEGAFWSERPEAKMVFFGSEPPECKVYTLDQEYFVRFIDSEHNSEDGNYIVFPVGSKIYTKGGKYYSAKCGNEIEFLKPVTSTKIIEKIVEKIVEVPVLKEQEEPDLPALPAPELKKEEVDDFQQKNYDQDFYEDDIYYRPEPRREIYWQVRLRMDGGSYGPPMLVDNRTFINNYQNNDNYYCEKTNSRPPVVKDPPHASGPDEGRDDDGNASGPGGRGTEDDNATGSGGRGDNGGNASGPGGSANGNNNTTGSGGRSASTRSQNQKFDHSNDMVLKSASPNSRNRSSFNRSTQSSYSGGTNKKSSYGSNVSPYSNGNRQTSLASSSRRNPSYGGASRGSSVGRSSSYGGASRGSSTRRR